jgi:hypothetical protein
MKSLTHSCEQTFDIYFNLFLFKVQNFLVFSDRQRKYLSGIPDYFPDGYSSGTLNYRSSGHFEVLLNKLESPNFKLFMSFSRFRLFLQKNVSFLKVLSIFDSKSTENFKKLIKAVIENS